jgi:HPt (histidine-containing phosphotransfer) domain-containing protein
MPPHESPIDENVLDGLHRMSRDGKPDLAKTVIMLFLESAPAVLQDLQRGVSGNDPGLLARASHTFAKSSAAVGAVLLSRRCHDLEAAARTGAISDSRARVEVIERLYAEAEGALRAWCAGR